MPVEIPDLVVQGGLVFFAGLFGAFLFYRVVLYANVKKAGLEEKYEERLNYYEKALVDIKIRLDALSIGGGERGASATDEAPKERRAPQGEEAPGHSAAEASGLSSAALINHTLQLVTKKSMTSRDIQITIGRTREHTARLMKRLSDEGLVKRGAGTRPYRYSITEKGRRHLEDGEEAAPQ